jgi:hypothetical protein
MVIGAGISAIQFMRHRSRFALCAGIGFLASILLLHFLDWTPVKPFRRLDAAVQESMTLAEVRSAVQREFPEHGRFPAPLRFESDPASEFGQMELFLARHSSFFIHLSFSDGRVTHKHSFLTPISGMAFPKIAALVAAGVCFLCWRSARRIFGVEPWAGHGIDVGSVAERLQCVRRDYLAEHRTRHNLACQRRSLLASAGLAVRRFPFFRDRTSERSLNPEDERQNG